MSSEKAEKQTTELPLTPERVARVVESNAKTFKGNGKEVRK